MHELTAKEVPTDGSHKGDTHAEFELDEPPKLHPEVEEADEVHLGPNESARSIYHLQ